MSRKRLLEQECLELLPERSSDDCEVSVIGRLFHTCAAATGKARSPRVQRRVTGTSSAVDDPEHSLRRESMLSVDTGASEGCSNSLAPRCLRPGPVDGRRCVRQYVAMFLYCLLKAGQLRLTAHRNPTPPAWCLAPGRGWPRRTSVATVTVVPRWPYEKLE